MRPCVGVPKLVSPLCSYKELQDGTYTLADVERFNQTLDEIMELWTEM